MIPFEKNGTKFANAVGVIEGNELKDEYIVLGAHFDHLGVKKGEIYPGADDNASGSASLIEVARELVSRRSELQRSVIIAAFDGEELGLYGSNALAEFLDAVVGIDKIKLMMSVDMVGWYKQSGKLWMTGTATIKDGRTLVKDAAKRHSVNVIAKDFENSVFTATDTEGFAMKKVPTLAVTTGTKSPYHKPGDKAELIDYQGLDKITEYLADLTVTTASNPSFKSSGRVARKHLGKIPLFEGGVVGSLGSTNMHFPSASIRSDSRMNYSAGLLGRLNFGSVGIQANALWEQASTRFPGLDEALGKPQTFTQRAITVPAYLLFRFSDSTSSLFAGLGGYYSYAYSQSFSTEAPAGWTANPHQGGLAATFGMQVAGLLLEWDFRWQLNNAFSSGREAKLNTGTFITLGWVF